MVSCTAIVFNSWMWSCALVLIMWEIVVWGRSILSSSL